MWNKPWRFTEGFLIVFGLAVCGCMLQLTVGPVRWAAFAFPINIIVLVFFLLLLITFYCLRNRLYGVRWMMTMPAAVTALIGTAILTIVMGFTRQVPAEHEGIAGIPGLSQMLSFWPFVLLYLWMTSIVGLVAIDRLIHHPWRQIPFLLNHLGLFVALVAGVLGNADMQRLKMVVQQDVPEWRATDDKGKMHQLDIAVVLHQFTIEEYPPKLTAIDSETGKPLPLGKPQTVVCEDSTSHGQILDWDIQVTKKLDYAARIADGDSTNYFCNFVEYNDIGATHAVYVKARNVKTNAKKEGWISCGSFYFPFEAMQLDKKSLLVMPDLEPKRFVSDVQILTKSGINERDTVSVNNPVSVEGWDIYQVDYDKEKGRWSAISVLEFVRDPWLPVVYTGIYMMLIGAAFLFFNARKRKLHN